MTAALTPTPPRRASVVWLAICAAATAWVCYRLAVAWPYVHSPVEIIMVLTVPGMLYFCLKLAHSRWGAARQIRWRKWLALLLSLIGGSFISGGLSSTMDTFSMARFETALAPLVAQVQAKAAVPCPPAATYALDPALADYVEDAGAPRSGLKLHHDTGRFVLSANGGSIDIDGSTVFYDSASRKWAKFHNDARERRAGFDALVKDLAECKLPLR